MNQNRIRYCQLDYNMDEYLEELDGWDIPHMGCGPTSIAIILTNYGFVKDPVEIAKKILTNRQGKFDAKFIKPTGTKHEGILYCLDRLINEDNLPISYELVKIEFDNPLQKKAEVINHIRNGHMAIMNVGPKEGYDKYQGIFSKGGHYLVISDVDDEENFYIINPNHLGLKQVGLPFSYYDLMQEAFGRPNSLNFLFIKKL